MLDSLPLPGTECSVSAWQIDWCAVDNDDLKLGATVIGDVDVDSRTRLACAANTVAAADASADPNAADDDESLAANRRNTKLNSINKKNFVYKNALSYALGNCKKTIQGK